MNKLFAKVIAKRTIAFLLIVVLITTSMPAVAHAESPTNKEFYFYFTNVNSDSTKEALINNLYLYYADTGLTIPLIDNYLILNEGPTYTGCYFIHLVSVPISRIVQIKNSHGMVVAEFSGENEANVYHPLTTINLSVDGTIIDTIYGYTNDITAPYDGTEEILQKDGLTFSGWYDEYGNKVADAEYGILKAPSDGFVTYYAGWTGHVHEWSTDWSTNDNYHWHECIGENTCDALISEKDGYGEHDYSGTIETITPPDCTNTGINKVYCSQDGCNAYKEVTTDNLGHLEDDKWTYSDTSHWHTCSRTDCDEKLNVASHNMSEWTITTPATYTERGSQTRYCLDCGYVETQDIPARNENHIHDYTGKEVVILEPTCTDYGTLRTYCFDSDCPSYYDSKIDPLDHKWIEKWEYNDTHHFEKCERCTEHNKEELHQFGDWIVVKDATFTEPGLMKRLCTVCGYIETKEIPYVETTTPEVTTEDEITSPEVTTEDETTSPEVTTEEETTSPEVTTEDETTSPEVTTEEETTTPEVTTEEETTSPEVTTEEETTSPEVTTENESTTAETTTVEETTEEETTTVDIAPPNNESDIDDDKSEDEEPPLKTGDYTPIQMYATLAMIAGFTYVVAMFGNNEGISEDQKKDILDKLIRWGKGKNRFKKGIALVGIFIFLLYYHTIEKNIYASKKQDILEKLS